MTSALKGKLPISRCLTVIGTEGLAAAVLGISARVLQDSYNRAGQAAAAQRFLAMLQADRAATEGMARRAFGDSEAGPDAAAD